MMQETSGRRVGWSRLTLDQKDALAVTYLILKNDPVWASKPLIEIAKAACEKYGKEIGVMLVTSTMPVELRRYAVNYLVSTFGAKNIFNDNCGIY